MPLWLQWIAHLNPMTYAISSVRKRVLEGLNWEVIAGIIGAFDLAMVAVCLWTIKRAMD